MKHHLSNTKGFRLIELLVIIGIIGILTTIAVPSWISGIPKYKLGAGARELLSAMNLARMTAIKENSNVVLSFDPGTGSLTAYVDNGEGGGTTDDKLRNGAERLVRFYQMPSGIQLLTPGFGQVISFNSRGIPDVNGVASVKNTLGQINTVRVLASGHARIQ